jgi:hypothetical protein
VGRSRDRFPVVSMDFSITYSFRSHHCPGVDSAPSENEYQERLLGVKATGAWGWQPHHLHEPNVMDIWEPKPGTLWTTPGLLRDCFTFLSQLESMYSGCTDQRNLNLDTGWNEWSVSQLSRWKNLPLTVAIEPQLLTRRDASSVNMPTKISRFHTVVSE